MTRTYNTADPFILRLDHLSWVEEASIRGVEMFLRQPIASIRVRPLLALGLALGVFIAVFMTAGIIPAHGSAMAAAPAVVTVRSDDLDFDHAPDAQVFLDRLEEAADKACGGTPDYREHRQLEVFARCRRSTIERAVERLDQPIVTQLAAMQPMPVRLAMR
jgi:UrcA family protein